MGLVLLYEPHWVLIFAGSTVGWNSSSNLDWLTWTSTCSHGAMGDETTRCCYLHAQSGLQLEWIS